MIQIYDFVQTLTRNNILLWFEKNYDVTLTLCDKANFLKTDLKIIWCHAWGIAVSLQKDFWCETNADTIWLENFVSRVEARDFKASNLANSVEKTVLRKIWGKIKRPERSNAGRGGGTLRRPRLVQRCGVGQARVGALRRAAPAQSAARGHSCNLLWKVRLKTQHILLSASNADYIFAWQPKSKYGAQLCQMSKTRQK